MPSTPVAPGTAAARSSSTAGGGQAVDPLRPLVDLDDEGHLRPDDRPQVMDVPIELLVPGQLEAGREQGALHRRCIRHEEIEVPEGAQRGIGVVGGCLRALEQDERTVAGLADALEQDRDDE